MWRVIARRYRSFSQPRETRETDRQPGVSAGEYDKGEKTDLFSWGEGKGKKGHRGYRKEREGNMVRKMPSQKNGPLKEDISDPNFLQKIEISHAREERKSRSNVR